MDIRQRKSLDVHHWPPAEGSVHLPYSTAGNALRDQTHRTRTVSMEQVAAVITDSGEFGETTSIYLVSAELYSVSLYLIIKTTDKNQ